MRYFLSKQRYWISVLLACMLSFAASVSAQTYHITSVDEWLTYAKGMAGTTTAAKTYRAANYILDADLDFSSTPFVPMGGVASIAGYAFMASSNTFTGTFDGNGHSVKGVSTYYSNNNGFNVLASGQQRSGVKSLGSGYAVFGISSGTIKNLIVDGFSIPKTPSTKFISNVYSVGGICAYMTGGTIDNCALINSTVFTGTAPSGAIVGRMADGTISNCIVDNSTLTNPGTQSTIVGGVVGEASGTVNIINCYVNATFEHVQSKTGGIIGYISSALSTISTIDKCYTTGSFTFDTKASSGYNTTSNGGIVGDAKNITITNSGSSIYFTVNSQNFAGSLGETAGIIGTVESGVTVSNLYATGDFRFSSESAANTMSGVNSFYGHLASGSSIIPTSPSQACYSAREYYETLHTAQFDVSPKGDIYGSPANLIGKDTMRSACLAKMMNDDQNLDKSNFIWNQVGSAFNGYPVPFVQSTSLLALMEKTGTITATGYDSLTTVLPSCTKAAPIQTEFHITSVAAMDSFAARVRDSVAGWSAGKTFIVDNDILDPVSSIVGSNAKPFLGTFDGGSHTINVSINTSDNNVGIIGVAGGSAKILNVQVVGSVTGGKNVGGVLGYTSSSSVTVSGCANGAVVTGSSNVGGIVGSTEGTVTSAVNVANITGTENVGGIAGTAASLTDCANMGYVTGPVTSTAGIAGTASGSLTRCLSAGYTLGAALSNGTAKVSNDSYYDQAVAVAGQTGPTAVTMSAATSITITGWSGAMGSYPVPSGFAATTIGKLAARAVYFVNGNKANAVTDSIVSPASVWTNSNESVIKYNEASYLPLAAGSASLSVSSEGITRNLPVIVKDPGLFSGGFGNTLSHFIIKTNADLDEMSTYVGKATNNGGEGKYFELVNDITDGPFTGTIGSSTNPFKGYFFSTTGSAFNIPLAISSTSSEATGLVGVNKGTIERISVTGYVKNTAATAGAVAGSNDGKLIQCFSAADVTGSVAGGVCGSASGAVSNCINIGRVSGTNYAAGISTASTSTAEVADCYNGGVVTSKNAAGVVTMTAGTSSVTPTFTNNVNVAAVNGSTNADALVYANAASPVISGGFYDAQHAVAASKNSGVTALATSKLVSQKISGWTSVASLYPQNTTFGVATVASAPVLLSSDSANNVKHDFEVATPAGVTWKSAQGRVDLNNGKAVRVSAGADTLIATMGSFIRRVPVFINCVWDTVTADPVTVCNMYAGKTYARDTVLADTTVEKSAVPNSDCGTISIRKVIVNVAEAGETHNFIGCGSYTYDGKVYTKDTLFTNSSCEYVNIKVYPTVKKVDSVVTVPCTQLSYTYSASNRTNYTVERTSFPISDSLLVIDTIKSTICTCDSLIRKVTVSVPAFVTDSVVAETQCNTFNYTNFAGKTVELGFGEESRKENKYYAAGVQPITYIDTNFVSPGVFTQIRKVNVNVYRSMFVTDTANFDDYLDQCTPITYTLDNGRQIVLDDSKYFGKDSIVYDSIYTEASASCPQTIAMVKLRLKGLSEVLDTVFIGAYGVSRCDTCSKVVVLNQLKGDEYNNVGFCDVVNYKKSDTDARAMPRTWKNNGKAVSIGYSPDGSCGYTIPYVFRINQSDTVHAFYEACDSIIYTPRNKNREKFTVYNDMVYNDTLSGVVPGCGCDSVWVVSFKVYHPTFVTFDTVTCNAYEFNYLDKSKGSLIVKNDTVIVDTIFNKLGCGDTIRTSNITVHHSYSADVNTPVEVVACQSYTYKSPVKGDIVCLADTTFSDSLTTQFGCDSVISVKVTIAKPVVIDSTINVCSDFTYKYHKVGGGTVTVTLGDNPDVLDTFLIEDVLKNKDAALCDTVFNLHVISHVTRVVKPAVTPVCGYMEYTRFNGSTFPIESSVTVYDTLKSKMCDCDSIVRIDSFVIGKPYYPTADTKLDTTLFGCRFSTVLTYQRRKNAWNSDTTIAFTPVSSEMANQKDFINIVRASNPSVVKLDTVRERLESGRTLVHYYWLANDTMKTITGCDSVVPFRVEYDGQHTLGRHYYYVDHAYAPFTYNGITYQEPAFNRGIVSYDSIEVTLPSTTGGCDTSYYAMVKMYPCKVIDTTMHWCDKASFYDLHRNLLTFAHDTVYSDTLRYVISASDTARCDSVIKTWHVKVGTTTPASLINPSYIGSCDEIAFHCTTPVSNMASQDTVFKESTLFRCHYVNASGCDSVVPIYATVHVVEPTTVYIRRTDYYQFKSLIDKSITRITSDTVIVEKIPNAITVPMPNGDAFTCDSIVTTNISIRPAEWRDTTIIGCDSVYAISSKSDSIRGGFNDMPKVWYKKDAKFDMPNSVNTNPYYHVTIKVNKSVHTHRTFEGCESVTYNGKVFKENTTLIGRYTSHSDCDSIDTVHIVVHPVEYREQTYDGCSFLKYGREVYTESDVVYDTVRYMNGCGCDSIITTINLVVNIPKQIDTVIDSCMFLTYPKRKVSEYNWLVRDTVFELTKADSVYTQSTSFYRYISTDVDENGCAAIEHTTLQVDPCFPYPVIINKYNWILTLNKDLLMKDVTASHITGYQWYKNGELLKGATSSYYTEDKALSGCYQVHVLYGDLELESENICIDSSYAVALNYDLYPDPVKVGGRVSIKCNFTDANVEANIFNMLGVKVYSGMIKVTDGESFELPYTTGSAGNYFLKLTTSEGTVLGKKFIVK